MAIKERKQITGTEAQIKGYAGHNGVLAYATDTKHLHVLSGTAGASTKLANVSDIPAPVDISGKADKTYVDTGLAGKADKTYVDTGLAGKANTSHTHTIANVTGLQDALNATIPKSGNRGALAGYSTSATGTIVDATSGDSLYAYANVTVANGATGQTWTKVVKMSAGTVTLGTNWAWVGGEAPELKYPCLLVCHWNQDKGIAGIVAGVA
jgi:hypothetical protein